MIANRSAKNGSATRPNSIAVAPSSARRKRRTSKRLRRSKAGTGDANRKDRLSSIVLPIADAHPVSPVRRDRTVCLHPVLEEKACRSVELNCETRGPAAIARPRAAASALRRERVALARLPADVAEVLARIAEQQRGLAVRRARVGLALEPALDRDERLARRLDADEGLGQHGAAIVERDQVRDAVALAGHDEDAV